MALFSLWFCHSKELFPWLLFQVTEQELKKIKKEETTESLVALSCYFQLLVRTQPNGLRDCMDLKRQKRRKIGSWTHGICLGGGGWSGGEGVVDQFLFS